MLLANASRALPSFFAKLQLLKVIFFTESSVIVLVPGGVGKRSADSEKPYPYVFKFLTMVLCWIITASEVDFTLPVFCLISSVLAMAPKLNSKVQ